MIVVTSTGAFDSSQFGETIVYHTWITPPGLNSGLVTQPTVTYIPVGRVDFDFVHPTLTDTRSVPFNFDATRISTSVSVGDTLAIGLQNVSNTSHNITPTGFDSFTAIPKTLVSHGDENGYGLYLNLTEPAIGTRDNILRVSWGPDVIFNITLDSLTFGVFEITKPLDAAPLGIDSLQLPNIQRTVAHFPEYNGAPVDFIFQTLITDTDNPNLYFDQTSVISGHGLDNGCVGNTDIQNSSQGTFTAGFESSQLGYSALWQAYVPGDKIIYNTDFNNPYRRQEDENIGVYFWDSLYLDLESRSIDEMVFGTLAIKHIYEFQAVYADGSINTLVFGIPSVIYAPQSMTGPESVDGMVFGLPNVVQYDTYYTMLYTAPSHIEYSSISINGLNIGPKDSYIELAVSKTMVPTESDYIEKHKMITRRGGTYKQSKVVVSPGEHLIAATTGPIQWRIRDIKEI